jgi:hypothetical protein
MREIVLVILGLLVLGGAWTYRSERVAPIEMASTDPNSDLYGLPFAAVREKLKAMPAPEGLMYARAPDYVVDAGDPTRIAWIYRRDNVELFRCVASLAPEGDGNTRVWTELRGSTQPGLDVEGELRKSPARRNLYVLAVREQIASTLARRAYEKGKLKAAIRAASDEKVQAINAMFDDAIARDRQANGSR